MQPFKFKLVFQIILLIVIFTFTFVWATTVIRDPYEVLGIKKTATIPEIKKAHKNLVKIWHPDKKRQNSENRFLEINHAYELLMDPERRENFDKHRITEDTPNFRSRPDYTEYRRHEMQHLDSVMFNQLVNQTDSVPNLFNLHHLDIFHRQTVTAKGYSSKVVSNSFIHPQLVLFYSDDLETCPHCSSGAVIWHRITAEFQQIGIQLSTVNVDKERSLTAKLGMQSKQLPAMIGVLEGNVRVYKEQQLSLHKSVEFVRKMLSFGRPVPQLQDNNYESFLSNWLSDNRVRVLFVTDENIIRLRYLVTAFKYREYAACAHVYVPRQSLVNSVQSDSTVPLSSYTSSVSSSPFSSAFVSSDSSESSQVSSNDSGLSTSNALQTSVKLASRYKLSGSIRWMLIFSENSSWPEAALSSQSEELRITLMWEMLEANKFLTLPRVTSQHLFDQLCPVESIRNKRVFCTMLITPNNSEEWEMHRQAMRRFVKQSGLSRSRFRFMYLNAATQPEFIRSLLTSHAVDRSTNDIKHNSNHHSASVAHDTTSDSHSDHIPISIAPQANNHNREQQMAEMGLADDPKVYFEIKPHPDDLALRVLILARSRWEHMLFEYLPMKWNASDFHHFNQTQEHLLKMLKRLYSTSSNSEFTHELNSITLLDENAKSLLGRIFNRLLILIDHMSDHLTKRELLPIFSVVLTVSFIALICYTMKYLVKLEEQRIEDTYRKLGKRRPDVSVRAQPPSDKLLIHELRGETYNGLVRLLKPGCRTIVLLCDISSRNKLLPKFYKAVYPYRKNKTLMFAFMMLEKNLDWYRKILEQALDKQKELNLNPKNCIGTVLSLNGFRKYFCVFHAKHTEARNSHRNSTNGAGEGSDNSDTSDIESGNLLQHTNRKYSLLNENVLLDDFLLDGLSGWLEKLFSANTHRYYIAYWPDQMK